MNEVTLGDKIYISSKRAAEITGYAKDYVGQLCREGHVDAKMIGRGWYVYEPSIRAHRFGIESLEATPAQEEVAEPAEGNSEAEVELVAGSNAWDKPIYTAEPPQTLPELPETPAEEVSPQTEETLTDMQSAWKEWFDRKQQVLSTPEIESPEVIDARNEQYDAEHEDVLEEQDDEVTLEDELPEENADEEVEIPLHRIEEAGESAPEVHTEAETSSQPIRIHTIEAPVPAYPSYYAAPEVRTQMEQYVPQSAVREPVTPYAAAQAPEAVIISERVIPKAGKGKKKNRVRKGNKGNATNAPMIALFVGISIVTIAITVIGSGIADRYVQTFSSHNPVVDFLTGTREIKNQ
ncbi:MAG: hypothetical protein JWL75_441 [Parcubacteria group bacterium]|nr:hypothetical protein [Parcubacteria group bacterium]